jgi:hypothetical protein
MELILENQLICKNLKGRVAPFSMHSAGTVKRYLKVRANLRHTIILAGYGFYSPVGVLMLLLVMDPMD